MIRNLVFDLLSDSVTNLGLMASFHSAYIMEIPRLATIETVVTMEVQVESKYLKRRVQVVTSFAEVRRHQLLLHRPARSSTHRLRSHPCKILLVLPHLSEFALTEQLYLRGSPLELVRSRAFHFLSLQPCKQVFIRGIMLFLLKKRITLLW